MDLKRLSIALSLLLVACSDSTSESVKAPKPYADMNFEERFLFMNDVVLPQMKPTFVAFDAKFANMSCTTCHGDGVSTGTYAMPTRDIAPLPGSEEAFYEYAKDPEHARWSQFMMSRVWPEMSELLEVPAFDPTTHPDGFSCSNCHTLLPTDR